LFAPVSTLTIFAIPKRFEGHFGMIQRNAVRSWARLDPRPEIVLLGADAGTAEMAAEVGARHVPDIAASASGAPMLDDVFAKGQRRASNSTVCFTNADIVLTPPWLDTVRRVERWRSRFLIVGRRWNLDVVDTLDFDNGDWSTALIGQAKQRGQLAPAVFIDYFVFPRGLLASVPPFVVGRPGYDNWLLWHARRQGIPLVDITDDAPVIHQNHDYSHIKGTAAGPGGRQSYLKGEDTRRNAELVGDWTRMYSIDHATHIVHGGAIRRAVQPHHVRARVETLRRRIITATQPVRRRFGIDAALVDSLRARLRRRLHRHEDGE
jgi:hypothetical protein